MKKRQKPYANYREEKKESEVIRYRFYWKTGETDEGEGTSPADALTHLGYGGGAVRALDYYKDITNEGK